MKTDPPCTEGDIIFLTVLLLVMWGTTLAALVKVASMLRQLGAQ